MSIFDSIADSALSVSQGVFAESCIVTRGSEEPENARAVFTHQAVEINNVQSTELTAEFITSEYAIQKDDIITREDETTWRVSFVQDNKDTRTAILKSYTIPEEEIEE